MLDLFSYFDVDPLLYKFLIPPFLAHDEFLKLVTDGIFPTFKGLYPAIYYAIALSIMRYILHHVMIKPFAVFAMNLKYPPAGYDKEFRVSDADLKFGRWMAADKAKIIAEVLLKEASQAEEMARIKNEIEANQDLADKIIHQAIETKNMSGAQPKHADVINYFRNKKKVLMNDKKVVKFVEAAWRLIFYSVFCLVGFRALFMPTTASWVLDTSNYWSGWPYVHQIDDKVLFYYLVELGAYLHQLAWTEVSRSDALEMITHHFVTILLIVFSYLLNFSRIGSVILLLHDTADVFLESAKCFNYASKSKKPWAHISKTICDVFFAFFAITFFVTRLVLFPRYVIYDVLYVSPITFNNDWFGYWTFAGLLIVLECLHIFWFYLVIKMVYRLVTTGIEKDERSDCEDEGEQEPNCPVASPVQNKFFEGKNE